MGDRNIREWKCHIRNGHSFAEIAIIQFSGTERVGRFVAEMPYVKVMAENRHNISVLNVLECIINSPSFLFKSGISIHHSRHISLLFNIWGCIAVLERRMEHI